MDGKARSQAMLPLGIGFAFVTVGAKIAGLLYNVGTVDLVTVKTVQSNGQATGLFIACPLARAKG